jgi:dolichol-phosphate mannosyltransferase
MANESRDFKEFTGCLLSVFDFLGGGTAYVVVDRASVDDTLKMCQQLSSKDSRFVTVWAPDNKNMVDAYVRGYKEALIHRHSYLIEMDAGLSHDPRSIPMFLRVLNEGNECAFGSRFIPGASSRGSTLWRTFLSRSGTVLSNLLLGTKMKDMTSGYMGFHSAVVERFVLHAFLSRAHFYQTELRYLLRNSRYIEVPIHYRSPSPRVSTKSVVNALEVLLHYFILRVKLSPQEISM